jgi:hypothetical protein
MVALQRRVPIVQRLFVQHVPDVLAEVVGGQLFQFERRMVFDQPVLQIAIVVFVVSQCPVLQAFCFFGSEEDAKIII